MQEEGEFAEITSQEDPAPRKGKSRRNISCTVTAVNKWELEIKPNHLASGLGSNRCGVWSRVGNSCTHSEGPFPFHCWSGLRSVHLLFPRRGSLSDKSFFESPFSDSD